MKMRNQSLVPILAVVIATCSFHQAIGQKSFIELDEVDNAATIYWQSFALLPELDESQLKMVNRIEIDAWSKKPNISKDDGKELLSILAKSEDSVALIDQISDEVTCNWGIVFSGPGTHLAHIGKARLLAKILQLSGEKALLYGMQDLAAKRFAQALRLGRHLGNEAIVLQLVGERIEEYVVATVTRHVDNAPNPANCTQLVKGLLERIQKLPQRPTVANAYRNEKKNFHGWIEKVLLSNDEESAEELEAAEKLLQVKDWAKTLKSSPIADRENAIKEMVKRYDELIAECENENSESQSSEKENPSDGARSILLLMLPTSQPIAESHLISKSWRDFVAKLEANQ